MYSKTLKKQQNRNPKDHNLVTLKESLRTAELHKNYYEFYDELRKTPYPFIPCQEREAGNMYQKCFNLLHSLGEVSIPVSVALSMHYYILGAVASYPFSVKSKEYWKREILLKKIKKERLLIANTGSVRTFKSISGGRAILAEKKNKQYIINGEAPFMSLSGIADYAVFTAQLIDGNKAVFFIPLDTKGIIFSENTFGESMSGSFTSSVAFRDLVVDDTHVIQLDASQDEKCELLIYQRSWFQALIPAPYLGASKVVLQQLVDFAAKKIKGSKKLIDSDQFLHTLGELEIKYKTALELVRNAQGALKNFKIDDQYKLQNLFESSVLAKYQATHFAEEIVSEARALMGTSFLMPDSITNKISKEIGFGVLQPMTDWDIRQYFGSQRIKS